MNSEERVVVVAPLVGKHNLREEVFVSSIPALGLTGYGNNMDEATQKVKRMFAAFVETHRKYDTLSEQLTKSGLRWYWESEYKGSGLKSAQIVSTSGKEMGVINPSSARNSAWVEMKELVVAG